MAKVDLKIAATSFEAPTNLTFEQVLAAADDAAHRAAGVVDKVVRDGPPAQGTIVYVVKRAGLTRIASFAVRYHLDPDGNAKVAFVPGNYVTSQPAFLFIPVGPKDSSALGPFKRFSKLLQAAVTQGNVR